MFVAIVSIELYAWLGRQKRLQITMPDSVPGNVSASFSALFPTIFTVTIIATAGFAIKALTGMYAYDIIYNVVQRPLEGIVQGLPGILLLMFIAQVFGSSGFMGTRWSNPFANHCCWQRSLSIRKLLKLERSTQYYYDAVLGYVYEYGRLWGYDWVADCDFDRRQAGGHAPNH